MLQSAAQKAYIIYSNAIVANGTTKQCIKDLYKYLEIEVADNENLRAQIVKLDLDIKRLEAGLVVPECMMRKKTN